MYQNGELTGRHGPTPSQMHFWDDDSICCWSWDPPPSGTPKGLLRVASFEVHIGYTVGGGVGSRSKGHVGSF